MLYNEAMDKGAGYGDFVQVMWHGASLDATTAGYLTALPLLVMLVSIWLKRVPLKKLLLPYYIIGAALIAIVFVVDMGLYPFWGFKLDASIFLYLDSPKEAMASVSVGFILLRLLVMVLLTGGIAWLMIKITPRELETVKNKMIGTLGMLLLGGVLFVVIRGGVTESTSNVGQVYFSSNQFFRETETPDILIGFESERLSEMLSQFVLETHGFATVVEIRDGAVQCKGYQHTTIFHLRQVVSGSALGRSLLSAGNHGDAGKY